MARIYLKDRQQPSVPQPSNAKTTKKALTGKRIYLKDRTTQATQTIQSPAQPPKTSILQKIGNFVRPMIQAGKETGAAFTDVALRTSPLEGLRNTVAGLRNINQPGGFRQGVTQSQARPLLYEKVAGVDVTQPGQGRKFIGRAMEAPTYLYAGTKGFLGSPVGNLGSRILSRSTAVLPEAGVNTALQQFEEGTLKNAPQNFARNAVAMALLSNLAGEAGRLRTSKGNIPLEERIIPQTSNAKLSPVRGEVPPPIPESVKTANIRKLAQPSDQLNVSYTTNTAPKAKSVKPNPLIQEDRKPSPFKIKEITDASSPEKVREAIMSGKSLAGADLSKSGMSRAEIEQLYKDKNIIDTVEKLRYKTGERVKDFLDNAIAEKGYNKLERRGIKYVMTNGKGDSMPVIGQPSLEYVKLKFSQPLQEGGKTLYRGTREKGILGGEGGVWATDSIDNAKKFGDTIENVPMPKKIAQYNPKEVANVIGFDDMPSEWERADWDKIAAFYNKKGYDAIDFGPMHSDNANDIWIFGKSQPLQEGVKTFKSQSLKERGHVKTIANSPEVSIDMAKNIRQNAEAITTRHQLPLVKEAQKTIFNNINEAERIAREEVSDRAVIMGDELVKHWDSIAIKAKRAGDMETFNLAMDRARKVVDSSAPNLTESARALSAANRINKASPEFVLSYVQKIAKESGADLKLSNEKMFEFMRKADEIKGIPDPRERAFATFDLIDDIAANVPRGKHDKLLEALNLPRSIMATGDLSAPLRQGIFTAARNPKMFAKNFAKMFKYAFSEDAYRGLKADIITSPNYHLYQKYKLPLTDIQTGLTGREEMFMSQMAEKIPGFGKIARGSDRAYTGFLNKMRVDLFDDFVKTAELNGIKDEKFFESAARFVGAATGRGNLFKTLEGSANALNAVFFSPRLMASRMSLINPLYYAKLHPVVRKEALKSLAAFVGTGTSILALAKLNGAEVGDDPRSADFGKIKIGNTRYDIWGGFQQYARLIGQLTTGEKISTITGKQTTLGEGYNAPTLKSILYDFFESKMAPIPSLISRGTEGTKFGEKFNLPAEVLDRFIPMLAQDAFDLYRERGLAGVAMAIPGAFGIGSQTYGDQVPMLTKTAIGNPSVKWRSQPGLGETIINKLAGKQLTNIPQDQWGPLYEERLNEQKRQIDIDAAKQRVLTTGKPEYVNETFIFLDNGVIKTKVIKPVERTPLLNQIKKSNLQPFYGN